MPTLTINIANSNTPLSDGTESFAGHMWYEISDGQNYTESYGFAPAKGGKAWGDGRVHYNDSNNYLDRAYTETIEITDYQYEMLQQFGMTPTDYGFDDYYQWRRVQF